LDAARLDANRLQFEGLARRSEEAIAQARVVHAQVREGRSQREIMHDSAYARLQARLESMPVIEQAKGIVMAQQRCGPDEAFDLLRRASQRANVKLHVLAAEIVEKISAGDNTEV
jgi:AmiR/NasT family two-component response regulator